LGKREKRKKKKKKRGGVWIGFTINPPLLVEKISRSWKEREGKGGRKRRGSRREVSEALFLLLSHEKKKKKKKGRKKPTSFPFRKKSPPWGRKAGKAIFNVPIDEKKRGRKFELTRRDAPLQKGKEKRDWGDLLPEYSHP